MTTRCKQAPDGGKLQVTVQRADVTLSFAVSSATQLDSMTGSMELELTMSGSMTEPFVLRQSGLSFHSCSLKPAHGSSFNELRCTTDDAALTAELRLNRLALSGPARMKLEWSCQVADKTAFQPRGAGDCGFFAIGNARQQCGDAAQIFPHFDQPCVYKIAFAGVPAGAAVVLANTKQESEKAEEGRPGFKRVSFVATEAVPASAITFCIGTFITDQKEIFADSIGFRRESVRVRLRRLKRCVSCSSRASSCHRMFDHVCTAVEAMMHMFQLCYPFEGADIVALPLKSDTDDASWQLLSPVLVDQDSFQCNAPSCREETVVQNIVRRILRNWVRAYLGTAEFSPVLGGLLMFLEYNFTAAVSDDWLVWDKFQTDVFDPLMSGRTNDRTLRYACHFRHLKQFLGKAAFFQAMRKFGLLMRDEGDSEHLPFLWNALEAERFASNSSSVENLERVLAVSRAPGELRVQQYYMDASRELHPSTACIHVVARFGPNGCSRFLLTDEQITITLSAAGPERFYLLNAKAAGLYRVWYSENMMDDIWHNIHALRDVELTFLILDFLVLFPVMYEQNIWAAAALVKLLKEVGRIKSPHMWRLLMPQFSRLLAHLEGTDQYETVACVLRRPFMKLSRKLLTKFAKSKLPERCHLETDNMQLLMSQVCCVTDFWTPMVAAAASASLDAFGQAKAIEDEEKVHNLMRPICLAGAAPCLADNTVHSLRERLDDAAFPAWSRAYLERALFACSSPDVLQNYIATLPPDEVLRVLREYPSRSLAIAVLELRHAKRSAVPKLAVPAARALCCDKEGDVFRAALARLSGQKVRISWGSSSQASKTVIYQYIPIVGAAAAGLALGYIVYRSWAQNGNSNNK